MKRFNGVIIPVIIVVITLLVLTLAGCGPDQSKAKIETTGTVEMTEVSISSKVGGKIVKMPVDEGQQLKQGDLLAELDHDELGCPNYRCQGQSGSSPAAVYEIGDRSGSKSKEKPG